MTKSQEKNQLIESHLESRDDHIQTMNLKQLL